MWSSPSERLFPGEARFQGNNVFPATQLVNIYTFTRLSIVGHSEDVPLDTCPWVGPRETEGSHRSLFVYLLPEWRRSRFGFGKGHKQEKSPYLRKT